MKGKKRMRSRGRAWVWLVGVAAVAIFSGCDYEGGHERYFVISGTVECDEVHVGPRVGGRVAQIFCREGDEVASGTLIAQLEAPELEARLAQARAALAEALAGARLEEIESAHSEWEALLAELQYARSDARRLRELRLQGSAAQAELEAAESRANYLERRADAARRRYELLVAGTRSEKIDQARAQVAELEAQVRELQVTSPPTTAVLESLTVRVGDVVPAYRSLAVFTLPHSLYVRFYIPALWLGQFEVGKLIDISSDSAPERTIRGVVQQVARSAEFTPRNVQTVGERIEQVYSIKVRLPESTLLRPGMTVTATIGSPLAPPPHYKASGRYGGGNTTR